MIVVPEDINRDYINPTDGRPTDATFKLFFQRPTKNKLSYLKEPHIIGRCVDARHLSSADVSADRQPTIGRL